jgi:hypothetical protein
MSNSKNTLSLIPRNTRVSTTFDERKGRVDGSSMERRKAGDGKWHNVIMYRIILDDGNTVQHPGKYVRALSDDKNATK